MIGCAAIAGVLAWWGYRMWRQERINRLQLEGRSAIQLPGTESLTRIATELQSLDPNDGYAWLFRAEAAKRDGRFEEAAEFLGKLRSDDPKRLQALLVRAELEWGELNRPWAGLETCEVVLAAEPRAAPAHARVISFYALTLQRPQMLVAIRRAIAVGSEPPEAYVYLQMADQLTFTNGPDITTRWLSADPDSVLFQVALAVHTAERLETQATAEVSDETTRRSAEAQRQITAFAERYPHHPLLLAHLLPRLSAQGDVAGVGRLLAQVPAEAWDDHLLWLYRGWYYAQHGRLDEAEQALLEALRLHPLSWQTRHEYAALLRRSGRLDEVEAVQELAVRGRALYADMIRLDTARDASPELLLRMADYAAECDDTPVAEALHHRVQQLGRGGYR